MTIRLLSVDFAEVRFYAVTDDACRFVTVRVNSGLDWLRACAFPHNNTDEGRSLGSDELNEQVRIRASEELVRLEAAVKVVRGRWAA
jgi:hypothetical protein